MGSDNVISNVQRMQAAAHTEQLSRIGIAASLINGALIVVVLWGEVATAVLVCWYTLIIAGALARLKYQTPRSQSGDSSPDLPQTSANLARNLTLGLILAGVVWGAVGLFAPVPSSDVVVFVIAAVLAGMMAGASVAYAALPFAAGAFLGLAALGIICLSIRLGWRESWPLAVVALLYPTMLFFLSRKIGSLIDHLVQGRSRVSEALDSLRREVSEKEMLGHQVNAAQEGLAQQARLTSLLLARAPVAFLLVDDDGVVREVYGSAIAWESIRAQDCRGRPLAQLPPPLSDLQALVESDSDSMTLTLEGRTIRWFVDPVEEKSGVRSLLTGVDVTESERLLRMQDEFLLAVNHRMRNSLAKARGALELFPLASRDQIHDIAAGGLSGVTELERLVARIGATNPRQVQVGRISLHRVLELLVEPFNTLAEDFDLQTEIPDDGGVEASIAGSACDIQSIAGEIARNVQQFAVPSTPVRVRIWTERGRIDAASLIMEVTNQCVCEDGNRMADTKSYYGFQLGLRIASLAAKRSRGDLQFDQTCGQATVRFRAPIIHRESTEKECA